MVLVWLQTDWAFPPPSGTWLVTSTPWWRRYWARCFTPPLWSPRSRPPPRFRPLLHRRRHRPLHLSSIISVVMAPSPGHAPTSVKRTRFVWPYCCPPLKIITTSSGYKVTLGYFVFDWIYCLIYLMGNLKIKVFIDFSCQILFNYHISYINFICQHPDKLWWIFSMLLQRIAPLFVLVQPMNEWMNVFIRFCFSWQTCTPGVRLQILLPRVVDQ